MKTHSDGEELPVTELELLRAAAAQNLRTLYRRMDDARRPRPRRVCMRQLRTRDVLPQRRDSD